MAMQKVKKIRGLGRFFSCRNNQFGAEECGGGFVCLNRIKDPKCIPYIYLKDMKNHMLQPS